VDVVHVDAVAADDDIVLHAAACLAAKIAWPRGHPGINLFLARDALHVVPDVLGVGFADAERGGEVDNLAVKEKIMKEFDGLISEKDLGEILEYIKEVKSELSKNKDKKRIDLSKFDQSNLLSDTEKEEDVFKGR
jgi:hypothetical protein